MVDFREISEVAFSHAKTFVALRSVSRSIGSPSYARANGLDSGETRQTLIRGTMEPSALLFIILIGLSKFVF